MRYSDIVGFKKITSELVLPDRCNKGGSPVKVDVYLDEKTWTAYQVNLEGKEFRKADAKTIGTYADWQSLED